MIITQVPLRISLLGGGTDLPEWTKEHQGCVLGSTIDKYIYIILSRRFDKKIVIGYSKQEIVDKIDNIQHELVKIAAAYCNMGTGWEVKTLADVPSEGSGLGSSSALLVGLIKIFNEFQSENIQLSQQQLAGAAYYLEREVLEKPVGVQDHLFAAIGGQGRFKLLDGSFIFDPIEIPQENLYLFYTGITRKSSDILSRQAENVDENLYERLSNLALNYLPEDLPDLLNENWRIKKKLAEGISNLAIEKMIDLAEQGGAIACKILGAGGGGFLLTYVTPDKIKTVRESLKNYQELPFKFVNHGARIVFNNE